MYQFSMVVLSGVIIPSMGFTTHLKLTFTETGKGSLSVLAQYGQILVKLNDGQVLFNIVED